MPAQQNQKQMQGVQKTEAPIEGVVYALSKLDRKAYAGVVHGHMMVATEARESLRRELHSSQRSLRSRITSLKRARTSGTLVWVGFLIINKDMYLAQLLLRLIYVYENQIFNDGLVMLHAAGNCGLKLPWIKLKSCSRATRHANHRPSKRSARSCSIMSSLALSRSKSRSASRASRSSSTALALLSWVLTSLLHAVS